MALLVGGLSRVFFSEGMDTYQTCGTQLVFPFIDKVSQTKSQQSLALISLQRGGFFPLGSPWRHPDVFSLFRLLPALSVLGLLEQSTLSSGSVFSRSRHTDDTRQKGNKKGRGRGNVHSSLYFISIAPPPCSPRLGPPRAVHISVPYFTFCPRSFLP